MRASGTMKRDRCDNLKHVMDLKIERLKYITAVTLYGTIGMFLRFVSLPSEVTAMCRGILGSVFIILFRLATGHRMDREAVKRNAKWLILSGITLGFNWIFLFAAYMTTTVAAASVLNYTAPIFVICLTPLLLKEKLEKRKLPYVALAFIGVLLVSGVSGSGTTLIGTIYSLSAALCFTAIVIFNRKISAINAYDKSVVQLALSAVTILPYALIHNHGTIPLPSGSSLWIVLMLGVVHTGFAYCLYFSGLKNLPVQTIAVLGYLEPVVSVLCSALFLHEPIGLAGMVGTVLVIGSAMLSELSGIKN